MRKTVAAMAAIAALATWPVLAQAPDTPMTPGAAGQPDAAAQPGAQPGAAGQPGDVTGVGVEANLRDIDPDMDAEMLVGRTVMSSDGFEIGQVEEFAPGEGDAVGFIIVSGGMLGDGIEIPVDQAGFDDTQEVVILQLTQDEVTGLTEDSTIPATPDAPAPAN